MGRTVILVENLLNLRQFPNHTLVANEEATDHEASKVTTGRRSANRNYWSPTTANSQATVTCTFDRVRVFDMCAVDRGHNLEGKQTLLLGSLDAFATSTTIYDITLPAIVQPSIHLDETPGVKTEEGAWLYRFPPHAAKEVRFQIPAMGAGLVPKIVGLYLGLSFRPEHPQQQRFSFGATELSYDEEVSATGWLAASDVANRDRGEMLFWFADRTEAEQARYHLRSLFMKRKPGWLVHDDELATRSHLAVAPPGVLDIHSGRDWSEPQAVVPWVEHEPKLP